AGGGGGAGGRPMRGRGRRADRGTRLGGAESKRRRRPRLPAPPSRVTLLAGPAGVAAPAAPALAACRGRRMVRPSVWPPVLAGLARRVVQVCEHGVLGDLPGQLEADEPLDCLQAVYVLLAREADRAARRARARRAPDAVHVVLGVEREVV